MGREGLERHVVYVFFLSFFALSIREYGSPCFPYILIAVLFLFFNYAIRFRVRELLPGVLLLILSLVVTSCFTFHRESKGAARVLWVEECGDGCRVAILEGWKCVKLKEEAEPGDFVNLKGEVVSRPAFSLERFRYRLYRRVEENVDYPISALVGATTLGFRYELPASVKGYFVLSGIYHFLAISGLHVGIVVGAFALLLKFLGFRKPLTVASISILPLMPLTGLPPSVLRSYLFVFFLAVGLETYRRITPLYLLGVVMLSTVLTGKFNLSAALSFSAVGGILLSVEKEEGVIMKSIKVSLAPILFTSPIILNIFGTLNLMGWLTTFLAGLLFTPFLIGAFLTQVTLGKFHLVNQITGFLGYQFILLSHYLFDMTKWSLTHYEAPLWVAGTTMLLMLFLALFTRPCYSFVPPVVLVLFSFFHPTVVSGVKVSLPGQKLNSFQFVSTGGQKYRSCVLKSSYIFPATRRFLYRNTLVDDRLKFLQQKRER